jgi:alpha-glucosidase
MEILMQNRDNNCHSKTAPPCSYIFNFFLYLACFGIVSVAQAGHVLKSPNGNAIVEFDLKNFGDKTDCPIYKVTYNNKLVITDSCLGLEIKDANPLGAGFEIVKVSRTNHDSTYSPVYGERKTIRDNYNQLVAELKESSPPYRRLILSFRAYNEGVAFCYTLPRQDALKNFVISAEKTQFRFTNDHTAYVVYSAQGRYSKVPISKIKNNCERPLTVEIEDGLFASVAEARLVDYARMRLSPEHDRPLTLVSSLSGEVRAATPMTTPWRAIMLGRSPGELLEQNYLLLNLNEPCAIEDISWIKPGKVIREVTLTTTGGKSCVDFAVEHNLQYVEFDAGWYGPENSDESDATTVSVDPKRLKGPLDLHQVIDYAKQRGIGIILYVNHKALERQLDEILPLYEKWGVKGVKYGFVQVGSQRWTSWLHEAVQRRPDTI